MSTFHTESPIGFAHRGGRAHFRENTVNAFKGALDLGIQGIETDGWLTSDGQVVLDHDGLVRSLFRPWGRKIGQIERDALPSHIPTFETLCEMLTADNHVQIDVKDAACAAEIVNVFRRFFPDSMDHLWLAHDGYKSSNAKLVASWRSLDPDIRLVDSTHLDRHGKSAKQYAEQLKLDGIDVINMPAKEWTTELVEDIHEAGLLCFAFNAQSTSLLRKLVAMKLDAIYSDHPDRLREALS